MLRFGVKLGIFAGVTYYIADQGVWKDSETTAELYEKVKKQTCPYVKMATDQLPFKLPSLPPADNVAQIGKHYWNAGVKNTFTFLCNSPTHLSNWSKSSYNWIAEFTKAPETSD